MTPDEISNDCRCNPWMIAAVMTWDWMIFLTQQMIVAHAQLHDKGWHDD